MRQIALFTAVVLSIMLAFLVAWQLISIVLLFLLSLVIAATLRAPIEGLMRHGVSRMLAMGVVYGLIVICTVALLLMISLSIMNEVELLAIDSTKVYERVQRSWQNGRRVGPLLAARLPAPEVVARWVADDYMAELVQSAMTLTQNITTVGSQLLLAIVLSIYWTADRLRFERIWLSLVPSSHRMQARQIWRGLEVNIGAYMRSEIAQSVLAGGLLTIGYWLLGLHYPFLLALTAALAWLIPLVGGLIALIPLLIIGWLNVAPASFLIAIVYTIIVLALMEFVVERRLYENNRYQKVTMLLVMIALVDAYGFLGLLIAPFLSTALQLLATKLLAASTTRQVAVPIPESMQTDLTALQARLQEAQELIQQERDEPNAKRLLSLSGRLSRLLDEADAIPVLQEGT